MFHDAINYEATSVRRKNPNGQSKENLALLAPWAAAMPFSFVHGQNPRTMRLFSTTCAFLVIKLISSAMALTHRTETTLHNVASFLHIP